MGVLSCPYRGEIIPRLSVRNTPATICNHPAVRGPCVLTASGGLMPSCLQCPKYWKDSPETVADKLAGLPTLDPAQWSPPEKPAAKPAASTPAQSTALPNCQHLGAYSHVVDCEACKKKLKVFACAVHGACTIAKPGVGVEGCCKGLDGKGCADFVPLEAVKPVPAKPATAATPPRIQPKPWVTVPPAPRLNLSPVLKRAVVTIAAGHEGQLLHLISGQLMRAYADRIGADFVVLDWPGHPLWPMSAKYAIPRTLDDHLYERIAYIDADVIVPPDAVDLLKLCEPDEFGAFDELPFVRRFPQYRQEQNYRMYRKMMGFAEVEHLPFYFNCGVIVVSRQHRDLLEPPTKPMPSGHCKEQDHTNAVVLDAFRAGLLKVRQLDRRANTQNWCSATDFADALPGSLLHFSGGGAIRKQRLELMQEWAEKFGAIPSRPTA